jgi:hypothetical protein
MELPGSTNGTPFEDSWATTGSEVRNAGTVVMTVVASEFEVGVLDGMEETLFEDS